MDAILNKLFIYAKEHARFLAPEAQVELHLGYRELMGAIKTLQERGAIKFVGGMCYEYNEVPSRADLIAKRRKELEMREQEILRSMKEEAAFYDDEEEMLAEFDESDDEDVNVVEDVEDTADDTFDENDENTENYVDAEDDANDALDEHEDSDSTMPDSIALRVLRYCVRCQIANLTLIQKIFPIGYDQATKIFAWMDSMGYIAPATGSPTRKMLLTEERFSELYGEAYENCMKEKDAAELRERSDNQSGALNQEPEAKDGETNISDKFLDIIKRSVDKSLFEVYRPSSANVCAKGLTFSNGERAEFLIQYKGKNLVLCDGGAVSKWMQCKPGYGYKRTKKALENLTKETMIRMDDREQLFVEVPDLTKLPAMYYYLYWLIESFIA